MQTCSREQFRAHGRIRRWDKKEINRELAGELTPAEEELPMEEEDKLFFENRLLPRHAVRIICR
jgi:hypothetical protein